MRMVVVGRRRDDGSVSGFDLDTDHIPRLGDIIIHKGEDLGKVVDVIWVIDKGNSFVELRLK